MKIERFLLTDFGLPKWQNYEITSVEKHTKNKEFIGELHHPIEEDIIHEERSVIKITNIILDGRTCYGDLEFFDTELGNEAYNNIKSGSRVSIRGSIETFNNKTFFKKIYTWDVV